jgi:hypothetical protein
MMDWISGSPRKSDKGAKPAKQASSSSACDLADRKVERTVDKMRAGRRGDVEGVSGLLACGGNVGSQTP